MTITVIKGLQADNILGDVVPSHGKDLIDSIDLLDIYQVLDRIANMVKGELSPLRVISIERLLDAAHEELSLLAFLPVSK